MAIVLPATFTGVDKFSSVVMKMDKSVGTFARKTEARVNRVNRAFRKLTPSLGKIGKQLLAFASITVLVSGLLAATNVAIDFEQANANLASVMGTTVEKNILLAKNAEKLGSVTAKSATEVVSLQEAYARLGFVQSEILNVTQATINGSIAMNGELAETANLTGAMIRTFDKFSSIDAPEILDQMTLATQKSALNFEKLNTSLPIVAGAANAAGIPFNKLLALLGKLSDAGIDASSSATSLRNIFLESAKRGHTYDKILDNIVKNQDKLTAANDKFGKRAAVSGVILAKQLDATDELATTLGGAAKGHELSGVAAITAAKQLDTVRGSLTLLKSAWEGLIIKISNSTGAMDSLKNKIDFVTRNLETILKTIKWFVIVLVGFKTLLLITSSALFVWNVALGISAAKSGIWSLAMKGNTVALGAYKTVLKIATINQWLLNSAIGLGLLPIIAIIAGIVAVILIIKNWGAITDWISEKWRLLGGFFKRINFVAMFRSIGASIVKFMLFPIIKLLELVSKIPGSIGDMASSALAGLDKLTIGIAGDVPAIAAKTVTNRPSPLVLQEEPVRNINLEQTRSEVFQETITKSFQEQFLNINVNDPNNRTDSTLNGQPIPINLSPVL